MITRGCKCCRLSLAAPTVVHRVNCVSHTVNCVHTINGTLRAQKAQPQLNPRAQVNARLSALMPPVNQVVAELVEPLQFQAPAAEPPDFRRLTAERRRVGPPPARLGR